MRLVIIALVACASSSQPPAPVAPPSSPPPAEETSEIERHSELAAAHRERLDEQATALAATCDQPAALRCQPSCYTRETADPRAGTRGAVEIVHVVCARGESYVVVDELEPVLRPVRGRFPKARKDELEAAVAAALGPDVSRGDVVRASGTWKPRVHPQTQERLRCTTVSHFTRLARPLDACGSRGAMACEAAGDHATHGLNVVHYRLHEARRLQAQGKSSECQQAALEAIAVARGMPRWRQYVSLNTGQWKSRPRYRTRFDGILDEDTLFATAIALGKEAEDVHVACGGAPNPTTTAEHEQSFHSCP